MNSRARVVGATFLALLGACGGDSVAAPGPAVPPSSTAAAANGAHVFIVVLENHEYDAVIGNSAMPYFNSLASRFGSASSYFASVHPSIGNYFMMTSGTMPTRDDHFSGVVDDDNIARALLAAGLRWRVYAQALPAVGYLGPDRGRYVRRHNPFAFFRDVVSDPSAARNIVPVEMLASDLATGALPDYGFIVPDLEHDAHDCPPGRSGCSDGEKLAAADAFLRSIVAPLVESPQFQASGVLFVTFDEGDSSDTRNGGGHVPMVVVSSRTPPGSVSTRLYQHPSLLATALAALGLRRSLGAAAQAPVMTDLYPL